MASERNLQSDPERPYSLVLPYGLSLYGAKVLPSDAEHPFLRIAIRDIVLNTQLVGSYNADNVMSAIAVGEQFGVSFEDAVKAVEAYVPSNNRSQMTRTEKNVLIVDAYNANPTSMDAALNNFASVVAERKVAMLGDMLELGDESVAEHITVVRKAISAGLDAVCFVGAEFAAAVSAEGAASESIRCFDTSQNLADWLSENPITGAAVLIKGSRGTRMEKVITVL
jgi:UDP-N-acetylmuramoyl-tripeptide--D-alanyl-D-alanine ligase